MNPAQPLASQNNQQKWIRKSLEGPMTQKENSQRWMKVKGTTGMQVVGRYFGNCTIILYPAYLVLRRNGKNPLRPKTFNLSSKRILRLSRRRLPLVTTASYACMSLSFPQHTLINKLGAGKKVKQRASHSWLGMWQHNSRTSHSMFILVLVCHILILWVRKHYREYLDLCAHFWVKPKASAPQGWKGISDL